MNKRTTEKILDTVTLPFFFFSFLAASMPAIRVMAGEIQNQTRLLEQMAVQQKAEQKVEKQSASELNRLSHERHQFMQHGDSFSFFD